VDDLLESLIGRVYGFALRLCRDRQRAEDLAQEALLRAWADRHRMREPQAARTWVFRIVANLWTDQCRRGRHLAARAGPLEVQPEAPGPDPAREAEGREELLRALAALDALRPRQREVLYLAAVEEMTPTEIANVLNLSRENVRAHLCLARKALRQVLREPAARPNK
jgi:RNA polymerase sigma-70 factor (ECF subfamily)